MNPQYLAPQKFGGPSQGFGTNHSSSILSTQSVQQPQNVSLGTQENAPLSGNQLPGQFPPPNFGDSAQKTHDAPQSNSQDLARNPFHSSVSKQSGDISNFQNGPSKFQNGPPPRFQNNLPQFQNGSPLGQLPPHVQSPSGPPLSGIGLTHGQNSFSQPPISGGQMSQSFSNRPPSSQPAHASQPSSLSEPLGHIGSGQLPQASINQGQQPPANQLLQPSTQLTQLPSNPQSQFIQTPPLSQYNQGPSPLGHGQQKGPTQQMNSLAMAPNRPGNSLPLLSGSNQHTGQLPLGPPRTGPPLSGYQKPTVSGQPPFAGQGASGNFSSLGNQNQYVPSLQCPPSAMHTPLPGQPNFGPNQLSKEMQSMNLNNQRQYIPGPMKPNTTAESPSNLAPPLNQPGYTNGPQARGPLGPGYPPIPGPGLLQGSGQVPLSGPGGYPQPNYQQQQQQNRRLDPDQMPSPIQVTLDDQQNRSGVFVTNQKGLVPPLVTTYFVVQDQGNVSPRFMRSTMYNVPITQDIVRQTAVPFSLVISPMARSIDQEYPPPIVNFGELGPVRCIRCKAYMCPFMQFIDSGRRFQCLFCKAVTDVPTEYFQHLDHTGQRMDRFERPELILGAYEFVATADYCRKNTLPKSPAIVFVIDVSYNNMKSGLVHLLCSQMKEIIQNLPVDQGHEKSNMRVGFITYNNSVHFYNIKGTLAAPQMMVVGDVHEMFMPLLDGFLCTPEESGPVIDALMQQIPSMFADTKETETVLLPAIQAGLEALKASECAGKLLVFHSTLPTAEAPGKLKNRDDRKLLGTDKEKSVLTPQNQAYNQLGQDCVAEGCSVDLFIFNNAYIDLATIGQVTRLTGGEIFKYTYFQADIDGERLINDVIMDISRPVAFDAVMRVRTSTGVRPTDFYGHFYMSNTTDMELASIDCDKAVVVEVKHDDKLTEDEGVYIQVALLYTSCSGQRRLRILNLSLKTCFQMADLYRSCDLDTIINYISKQSVYKLLDNNPKAVKDAIVNRAAQILATYRKNCASPSSAGQLILPECMKLLPLYVNCLLKSDAISGGSDMTIDERSFMMQAVMTMDIPTSVNYFYPRLIPLHDLDISKKPATIPAPIRSSIEKISEQGIYMLENGIHMFLWFGLGVNPDLIQKLFGAPSAIQVDLDQVGLPELDNPFSLAVRSIIDEIRLQRHRCMRLTVVRQREKLEPVFKHYLIEDRSMDGSPSYVDFLCHLHKEIRALLS